MLGFVGSSLKVVKFFMQHVWMLHDIVFVWPALCSNVAPRHKQYSSICNTYHVAKRPNRLAKRTQLLAPNKVASKSFGLGLQMLDQQCYDILRWNVALVWPGLHQIYLIALLNNFFFLSIGILGCRYIFFVKNVSTHNINNRKINISGLSGRINGLKLQKNCTGQDLRMKPLAV